MEITWLGHASFKIKVNDLIIYIDPVGERELFQDKADIILISHDHHDHWSRERLNDILGDETTIYSTASVASEIYGVTVMKPGQSIEDRNIKITTTHAYQERKRHNFPHPEGEGLGFFIEADNKKIFYVGDTDALPTHAQLPSLDVLMIPVGGTYVLTPQEAATLTEQLEPRIAIPMHWGGIVGHQDDALLYRDLIAGRVPTKVEIIDQGKSITL